MSSTEPGNTRIGTCLGGEVGYGPLTSRNLALCCGTGLWEYCPYHNPSALWDLSAPDPRGMALFSIFFFIPKTTLLGIVWKIMFSSLPIQSYQARYGLLPVSPQSSLGRPSQCSSGPRGGGQFREGGRKLSLPASLSLGGRPLASFTPISCGCRQLWRKAEKKVQVWVRDRYSEICVPLPPCNNWPAACSCPLTKVSPV